MYFQQGWLTGKAMYRSLERSTQDTPDGLFCTVPRPHFLGRTLIWPGYLGEHILGLCGQPRPQGLLAFQYGGGRREDPGTQRTKTIADWCIP